MASTWLREMLTVIKNPTNNKAETIRVRVINGSSRQEGEHKQQGTCPLKVSPNEMLNPETKMIPPEPLFIVNILVTSHIGSPLYDMLNGILQDSVVFLPKINKPNLIMRKYETKPNKIHYTKQLASYKCHVHKL